MGDMAPAADLDFSTSTPAADMMERGIFPTIPIMGMRVQAPRSMLKAIRRMCFHEVDYQPWLGAHCDFAKQQRRMERLVQYTCPFWVARA